MVTVRTYWESFLNLYKWRDEVINMMKRGQNYDIFVPRADMEAKYGKRVHFGIVRPKSDTDPIYKVELRMDKDGTYEKYFKENWSEIRGRLSELGGVLYSDPTAVSEENEDIIALKFNVDKVGEIEEYRRIFQVYLEFKKIISEYCPLEA